MHRFYGGWGRRGRHLLFLSSCVVAFGCGNVFDLASGDDGPRNKVSGRITSVNIASDTRDIIVFVYTDLCDTDDANPVVCALPLPEALPQLTEDDYRGVETDRVRARSNGKFLVKKVRRGDLTIAFLQDSATDRDQTIDPEDVTITRDAQDNIIPAADNAVSVLAHRNILDDARGIVVRLPTVDIDFPSASAVAPPEESTTSTSRTTMQSSSTTSTSQTTIAASSTTSSSSTTTN